MLLFILVQSGQQEEDCCPRMQGQTAVAWIGNREVVAVVRRGRIQDVFGKLEDET